MTDSQIDRREGHFKGFAGCDLYYQSWTFGEKPNATFVITHGIGEHSESYHHTAKALVEKGYAVYAWDLRGHGRSEGKRGYVEDFKYYSKDLVVFLNFLEKKKAPGPVVLFGHSLGGLILLRYLVDADINSASKLKAQATVLSSPALGVSVAVPKIKDIAAGVLNKYWPTFTMYNELKNEDLTSLQDYLSAYDRDPLRHYRISAHLYFGMLEGFEFVNANVEKLKGPVLMQAARKERIVSLPAIESFYDRVTAAPKKLIIYEDSLHEIYNDLQKERVIDDLDQFLRATIRG
jgi:alpha-beta hydrolase superfamily lysophospholipase